MHKLVFRADAGNELAHIRADHVQVDVQRYLIELLLMRSGIRLGAQKSQLLTAAEDEPQAIAQRRFCFQRIENTEQTNTTGHVVIQTVRQRRRIIMCGQNDPFIRCARNLCNNIVGFFDALCLLHTDADHLRRGFHQCKRILGIDIDARYFSALGNIWAQHFRINVAVGIMHVTVICNKPDSARIQQVLIGPVGNAGIQQNDFSLCL